MEPDVNITRYVLVEKAPFFVKLYSTGGGWWYSGGQEDGKYFEVMVAGNNTLKKCQFGYVGHIKNGCYIIISGLYKNYLIAHRDAKRIIRQDVTKLLN